MMLAYCKERGHTCMEDEILRYAQNDKDYLCSLVPYCLRAWIWNLGRLSERPVHDRKAV